MTVASQKTKMQLVNEREALQQKIAMLANRVVEQNDLIGDFVRIGDFEQANEERVTLSEVKELLNEARRSLNAINKQLDS